MIRDNGGWSSFNMVVVEEYPCENSQQAHMREDVVMRELSANMNQYRAYRSLEERLEYCAEQNRIHYAKNTEKYRELHRIHYLKNCEKIKEQNRIRYLKNREKRREQARVHYLKNCEKIKEQTRIRYAKNREKKKNQSTE
jgi:hypothetical protein